MNSIPALVSAQEDQPAALSVTNQWRVKLEANDRPCESTPLIPEAEAKIVLAELDLAKQAVGPAGAVGCAKMLIGAYPARAVHDPQTFIAMLSGVFADYPNEACKAAIKALWRECKFLPTGAEAVEALEAEFAPVRKLWSAAKRQVDEHERRHREKPLKAYRDKTPEEKARTDKAIAMAVAAVSNLQ